MIALRRGPLVVGLLLLLIGCSSQEEEHAAAQKYYFLESLQQIESGGRQLQSSGLDEAALEAALATLDNGLRLAFQVERPFLDELDLRLGKNYQRYFVAGVENYRVGIEAGDESQQREGLRLLGQWSVFWRAEREAILTRLESEQ